MAKPNKKTLIGDTYRNNDNISAKSVVNMTNNSVIVFDFDDTLFPTSKFDEILARESEVWFPDVSGPSNTIKNGTK